MPVPAPWFHDPPAKIASKIIYKLFPNWFVTPRSDVRLFLSIKPKEKKRFSSISQKCGDKVSVNVEKKSGHRPKVTKPRFFFDIVVNVGRPINPKEKFSKVFKMAFLQKWVCPNEIEWQLIGQEYQLRIFFSTYSQTALLFLRSKWHCQNFSLPPYATAWFEPTSYTTLRTLKDALLADLQHRGSLDS